MLYLKWGDYFTVNLSSVVMLLIIKEFIEYCAPAFNLFEKPVVEDIRFKQAHYFWGSSSILLM